MNKTEQILERIKQEVPRPTEHPQYGEANVEWLGDRNNNPCSCDGYFLCHHRYDWMMDKIRGILESELSGGKNDNLHM